MKRYGLLLTTLGFAFSACSSDGRKANTDEQQAATTFVRSALSARDSFTAPNAMPVLPVGFSFMPNGTPDCVVRTSVGGVERLTFHCTEDGITVSGTLARGGDHVTIDLHATGRITLDFTGDLMINEHEINGTLTMQATQVDLNVRASAAYDHIKLDDARCPIGGRLRFDAEVSAHGRSQARDLEIGFGPVCGDVTVFD